MLYAGYTIGDMFNDFNGWLSKSSFIERLTLYLCVAYSILILGVILLGV